MSDAATEIAAALKRHLHATSLLQRRLGHSEFRIAAMRKFEELGLLEHGITIAQLDVDKYLTPAELAQREQTP